MSGKLNRVDEAGRDVAAKSTHREQKADDSLFWADIDQIGGLIVGSYMAGFFREEYAATDKIKRGVWL